MHPYHINNHDGWLWRFVCCVLIVQHIVAADVASLWYFMTALMGVVQHTKRTNLDVYTCIWFALCFRGGIRTESISRAISTKLTPLEPPSSPTNSTSFSCKAYPKYAAFCATHATFLFFYIFLIFVKLSDCPWKR